VAAELLRESELHTMEPTVTAVGWLWRGACGVVRVTPRTRSASNAKGLRMAWEDDIFDADAVDVSAWARELGFREDPRISALVKLVVRRCAVMVQTAGPQGDSDWVPAHHAAAMADAVALKLLQQFEADPNEVVLGIPHPYQRTHMVRPQRGFLDASRSAQRHLGRLRSDRTRMDPAIHGAAAGSQPNGVGGGLRDDRKRSAPVAKSWRQLSRWSPERRRRFGSRRLDRRRR
jgi:hypothetical protein